MIRRRALLAAAALWLTSSTLARADEVEDIVRWLRQLGFDDVSTSRSLLGRVQIRATGAIGTRELVVNPRTGEILRDVWLDADGKPVRGAPYPGSDDDEGGDGGDDNGDRGGGDSGHGGGDDGGNDGEGDDSDSDDSDSDDGGSENEGSGKDGSDD